MGVGEGCEPDEFTRSVTEKMVAELLELVHPRFCFVERESVDFGYGRIIAEGLKDGERYAIIVATAGQEVDDIIHRYRDEGDLVSAFVADSIASEIAEATVRCAIDYIESTIAPHERMSNPYSPGYCGWLLKEQRILFSYFDQQPCDVTLNDSCLMLPVKSVSCVVAIGRDVVKAPYGCAVCGKSDCYKKRL